MRSLLVTFALLIIISLSQQLYAQDKVQKFSIETEPVAYILGGAGMTGSYQHGNWTYSIEAFGGLTVPESLHGNEGFETALEGIELQVERFLTRTEGFFFGSEVGISNLEITHKQSDSSESRTDFSVGLRGGYHWNTGLGNLYLSPIAGASYALSAEDIEIENKTFESGPVTPFATVGIGWSL